MWHLMIFPLPSKQDLKANSCFIARPQKWCPRPYLNHRVHQHLHDQKTEAALLVSSMCWVSSYSCISSGLADPTSLLRPAYSVIWCDGFCKAGRELQKQSIAAQGEAFCNPRHWREAPLGLRNPGSYFPWHEALSRLSLPPRGEFGSSRHPLQSCCEPGLPGYPSSWVPACLSSTAERNELGEWAVWWFHGWVPLSDSGPTPPSCWDWHPQLVENN